MSVDADIRYMSADELNRMEKQAETVSKEDVSDAVEDVRINGHDTPNFYIPSNKAIALGLDNPFDWWARVAVAPSKTVLIFDFFDFEKSEFYKFSSSSGAGGNISAAGILNRTTKYAPERIKNLDSRVQNGKLIVDLGNLPDISTK